MGNLDRDRLDCGDFQTATAVAEILRPRLHARRGSSCNHAVQKMPSVHKQDIASQAQGFDRVSEGRSKKIPCYQHLGLGRRRRPGGFRAISPFIRERPSLSTGCFEVFSWRVTAHKDTLSPSLGELPFSRLRRPAGAAAVCCPFSLQPHACWPSQRSVICRSRLLRLSCEARINLRRLARLILTPSLSFLPCQ